MLILAHMKQRHYADMDHQPTGTCPRNDAVTYKTFAQLGDLGTFGKEGRHTLGPGIIYPQSTRSCDDVPRRLGCGVSICTRLIHQTMGACWQDGGNLGTLN